MGEDVVERISIEIGASSEKATSSINSLIDSMKKLRSEIGKGLSTGAGKKKSGLTSELQGIKDSLKSFKALYKIANSFGRIAFYRLIRSAIKMVTDALQEGTENAYNFSKAFGDSTAGVQTIAQAYDQLSTATFKLTNQLGAAWSSLVRAITPALLQIIDLVTRAANVITQFFAAISGSGTYLKAIDYNKQWGESASQAAKSAKEWKNQLLGFDEINRLEAPTDPNSGRGSDATPDYGNMYEIAEVDSKIAAIADKFDKVKELVQNHLDELKLVAYSGLLGIGLVLTLTGTNIPLGLAFIAAGAIGMVNEIIPNWEEITEKVGGTLKAIELAGFGASFGVGLAMALSGTNIPLGLALMAAGALGIASSAALNWEELPEKIRKTIGDINLIVGGGLLAVGALLAFSTANIPLGIALMAAGVATMVTGVAINWEWMAGNIAGVLDGLALIVSGALLALGIIITLATPTFSPIGIGLIAAGAVGLIGAAAVNWEWLKTQLAGTLGAIMMIVGGFLAVIGIILLLSGNIPFGLGFLIAGAAAFGVGAANYDWGALGETIRTKLEEIKKTVEEKVGQSKEKIATGWENIKKNAVTKWEEIKKSINEKTAKISEDVHNWVENNLKKKIEEAWNSIKESTSSSWENVKQKMSGKLDNIKEKASTAWGNLKDAVSRDNTQIQSDTDSKTTQLEGTVDRKYSSIKNKVTTIMQTIKSTMQNSWQSIVTNVTQAVSNLYTKITETFSNIVNMIKNKVEEMKQTMNFSWSIPRPKIPVITWTYNYVQSGDGSTFAIPQFFVNWYAKGGIFDEATLIGVGEHGKEAVVPLENNTEWIDMIAARMQKSGGMDAGGTADAVEEGSLEIVNALYAVTTQIIAAMKENGNRETGSGDFDSFVRRVTSTQHKQARASGIA